MQRTITQQMSAPTRNSPESDLTGLLWNDPRILSFVSVRDAENSNREKRAKVVRGMESQSSLTGEQGEATFTVKDLFSDIQYTVGLRRSCLQLAFQLDGRWMVVTAATDFDILAVADMIVDQIN